MKSHSTGKMWHGGPERLGLKFRQFDARAQALDHWAIPPLFPGLGALRLGDKHLSARLVLKPRVLMMLIKFRFKS